MSDTGTFPDLASLTDALGYTAPDASTDFQMVAPPSEISYATQNLQPPTPLYVTTSDTLQFNVWNHVAGIEVDVTGRVLLADGTVQRIFQQTFPTNNRVQNQVNIKMPQGFLLDVSVNTPTSAVARGQCFGQVVLVRGASASLSAVQLLCQDYAATGLAMQWPGGLIRSPIEGPGFIVSQQTTVGAGLDFSFVVPANTRWRIRTLAAFLTTSATVANRFPGITLRDTVSNIYYFFTLNASQPASNGQWWTYAPGVTSQAGGGSTNVVSLPVDTALFSNMKVSTATNGLQAGDQWSSINMSVEEWIEPQ